MSTLASTSLAHSLAHPHRLPSSSRTARSGSAHRTRSTRPRSTPSTTSAPSSTSSSSTPSTACTPSSTTTVRTLALSLFAPFYRTRARELTQSRPHPAHSVPLGQAVPPRRRRRQVEEEAALARGRRHVRARRARDGPVRGDDRRRDQELELRQGPHQPGAPSSALLLSRSVCGARH